VGVGGVPAGVGQGCFVVPAEQVGELGVRERETLCLDPMS